MQFKPFFNKSVGRTPLPQLVKLILTGLRNVLGLSTANAFTAKIAADYEAWRDRFLLERLRLGLWLAILFNFTILVAIQATVARPELKKLLPSIPSLIAAIELSLLLCLALLKTRSARRYPGFLFLYFSWSVTLVEQIWATLHRVALPDLGAWSIVFLTQATLMPVRWRLHLISQLGVLAYYFGVNSLLSLSLPDGKRFFALEHSADWLSIFWFCLICDLSIYMYESLKRSEFKAKREVEAAYQKLEVAEAKYRSIFENAGEGIFQSTPEGRAITANPTLARILGYDTPEDVIAHYTDIARQLYVDPNRRAEFVRLMEQHGAVSKFETQVYRKDGSIIWMSMNARVARDESGNPVYYEGLIEDITERKRAEEALRVFFHAVSHDLRNPVIGSLMVVKNLLANPEAKIMISRSILERMVQSGDRQLNLINSLLEAHVSEVRGLVCKCEPLQLSQVVEGAIVDLEPMLAENKATLTNLISADLPTVNADVTHLGRVFSNLIANALKHNPPGLSITLSATAKEQMIRCSVQDNGVGMSQDVSEHLFNLYTRGTQTRHSLSLGLGLYLCRQIIKAHGGEIGVISTPGAGATFWFTLPIVQPSTSKG
ncbi:MAG TPA: ATP-binding protein [Coleofasciculaceae cyanobacterium]|jgi:PAS domain S-box-containing protein